MKYVYIIYDCGYDNGEVRQGVIRAFSTKSGAIKWLDWKGYVYSKEHGVYVHTECIGDNDNHLDAYDIQKMLINRIKKDEYFVQKKGRDKNE